MCQSILSKPIFLPVSGGIEGTVASLALWLLAALLLLISGSMMSTSFSNCISVDKCTWTSAVFSVHAAFLNRMG